MVAYLGLSLAMCFPAEFCSDNDHRIKPVIVWTGTDSAVSMGGFYRFRSRQEWETCWKRHRPATEEAPWHPCPTVDFDRYMIVAIFHGESSVNCGINVVEILEGEQHIRVRFDPQWYQTGLSNFSVLGGKETSDREIDFGKHDTQSFAFAVVPRSEKGLIFEEDVQGHIGEPPVWSEKGRVPPIEDE